MRKDGAITIFLSLIFVCVAALIFGLVESARTAGVNYYLQTAADSALDSVFSEFDNKLWESVGSGFFLYFLPYYLPYYDH